MTEAKKGSRSTVAKPATQTKATVAKVPAPAKQSPTKKPAPTKATAAKVSAPAKQSLAKKPAPTKSSAAAKPAVKAKSESAAKPSRPRSKKPAGVSPEQRLNYIEVAAYYIAARRGFAPGDSLQDWIQAEAEIDRLLGEGRLGMLGD